MIPNVENHLQSQLDGFISDGLPVGYRSPLGNS